MNQIAIRARCFHSSSRAFHLVAPPHPISHFRPIIYDDAPPPAATAVAHHPYSLAEFDPHGASETHDDYKLQWKLERQQLDVFHHEYWLDSNTRFENGKEAVLSGLPATADALAKETALSEFYKQWVMQEKQRSDEYTTEWRKRNYRHIKLGARVAFRDFASRIHQLLPFN